MANIEDLLCPGSTETPDCKCGGEMRIAKREPHPSFEKTEKRTYECDCGHTMHLLVWAEA